MSRGYSCSILHRRGQVLHMELLVSRSAGCSPGLAQVKHWWDMEEEMQEGEACMLPPHSHCLYGKAAQQRSVLVQFKHLCCSLHGTFITMLSLAKSLLVSAHTTSCPCSWGAPSQLHVSIHSTVPQPWEHHHGHCWSLGPLCYFEPHLLCNVPTYFLLLAPLSVVLGWI